MSGSRETSTGAINTYPEANSNYPTKFGQFSVLLWSGFEAIEAHRSNLHIGVTPTSGADTPAYRPYSVLSSD